MSRRWLIVAALCVAACRRSPPPESKRVTPDDDRTREAEAMLPDPSSLTLFAIAPQKPKPGERLFHGYPIIGDVPIEDAQQRRDMVARLRKDIVAGGEQALCFWPRHGLRAIRDGTTVDAVICFQCSTVEVHRGSQAWRVPLTPTVRASLDDALARSGFVRPPEREPLYEAH